MQGVESKEATGDAGTRESGPGAGNSAAGTGHGSRQRTRQRNVAPVPATRQHRGAPESGSETGPASSRRRVEGPVRKGCQRRIASTFA